MGTYRKQFVALSGAALLAGLSPVHGQEAPADPIPAADPNAPGGLTLTFGLETSLRVNDNLDLDDPSPGTSTIWDNVLSFGLLSETQTQRLAFDIAGTARFADLPGTGSDADFDDIDAALDYQLSGANSQLGFTAAYRSVDLDFFEPLRLLDDLDSTDLINDNGTRETRNLGLNFETGINDPFGFILDLNHRAREFSDTLDPGLFDTETNSAEATGRFQLSPTATARLVGFYEVYDAEDANQTERTTQSLTAGLNYALSPVTTLDISLGYTEVEETQNIAPLVDIEDGITGAISLTRELTNGTTGVELSSELTTTGRRTSLVFNRDFDLPLGSLAFSIGATDNPTGSTRAIGSIDYLYEQAAGSFTASLSREYNTNTQGNDVRTTRAAIGYDSDINAISSISLDFDYVEVADDGVGAVNTTERTSLRAAYNRELTEDWDLSAGFEHRIRDTALESADSNELFLTLSREITVRR